jgi:hypothetical protein
MLLFHVFNKRPLPLTAIKVQHSSKSQWQWGIENVRCGLRTVFAPAVPPPRPPRVRPLDGPDTDLCAGLGGMVVGCVWMWNYWAATTLFARRFRKAAKRATTRPMLEWVISDKLRRIGWVRCEYIYMFGVEEVRSGYRELGGIC